MARAKTILRDNLDDFNYQEGREKSGGALAPPDLKASRHFLPREARQARLPRFLPSLSVGKTISHHRKGNK